MVSNASSVGIPNDRDQLQQPSMAASMSAPRIGAVATLLKTGDVLVAGGEDQGGVLASAELYHPATNSWSSAGAMSVARSLDTATRLKDGRVLVTGGKSSPFAPASADLYDPVSNTWSPAASMSAPRLAHTATLLGDGRVLVAGGSRSAIVDQPQTSAEVYDPTTDSWSGAGNLATPVCRRAGNGNVGGFVRWGLYSLPCRG